MKKVSLLLLAVLVLAAFGTNSDKAEAKEESPKNKEKKEVKSAIEVIDTSGESITF
jgi:hypothetical protein